MQIIIFENKIQIITLPVSYEPSCVALTSDKNIVAVGGSADNTVKILTNFFCLVFLNIYFIIVRYCSN